MPTVHLIEGPVGAGKSTFAIALSIHTKGVHIALDKWFVRLYNADRPAEQIMPWYIERKHRLQGLIWEHSCQILATGTDVILELGLIQRRSRTAFCRQVQEAGYELMVHLLDTPRDIRRQRVQHRNTEQGATFAMVVPDHIFELASDSWEAPDEVECSQYTIEWVTTHNSSIHEKT
ncbi:ATP-binding protein [Chitinivorax sp. B]|uniref:AAA family ATPase n=1 Tax=Chitinivorax sp. B TaxID=2502235 RepID=UPI0010F50F37|nr:ATP-binding protein [Chitinivorax sp. B]